MTTTTERPSLLLSSDELAELTGYRQRAHQREWLARTLAIVPPTRRDGSLVVSRAQVEAALAGRDAKRAGGPRWSKAA